MAFIIRTARMIPYFLLVVGCLFLLSMTVKWVITWFLDHAEDQFRWAKDSVKRVWGWLPDLPKRKKKDDENSLT